MPPIATTVQSNRRQANPHGIPKQAAPEGCLRIQVKATSSKGTTPMTYLLGLLLLGLWRMRAPSGGPVRPSWRVIPVRAGSQPAATRQASARLIHAPPPPLLT